ncbi:hypothetical protein [Streptosporangium sandarakinum]
MTLINPCPTFVHRARLHQLVGGTDSAVVDYQESWRRASGRWPTA